MKNTLLRPTVWRTARVLKNERRLRLLKEVLTGNGEKSVSELARDVKLAVSTTSIYLRALNARGLISVINDAGYVFYGNRKDRSLPEAQKIQSAFGRFFKNKTLSRDWAKKLSVLMTAYANSRRLNIIKFLSSRQAATISEIAKKIGVPVMSVSRHMRLFCKAGLAFETDDGYSLRKPVNRIDAVMREIVLSDI